MEPDAVAIRLDPLRVATKELEGTTPIVIFAEQGQTGANLEEASLPSRGREQKGAINHKYDISDIVIVVDRSESMRSAVTPTDGTSKLDHLKRDLAQLQTEYPGAKISLVTFNSAAAQVPLPDPGDLHAVQNALSTVTPRGGTQFSSAFTVVEQILKQESRPESRKVVIFATDGQDEAWRERAYDLAESIRGHNALSFLVGVGADYDLPNIIKLAEKFGFSGWAHTPMPAKINAFSTMLPALLEDLQSAEHYLKIKAVDTVAGFYGLTPAIRRADGDTFYIGYQSEGIGICFSRRDNPRLELEVGAHVSDSRATIKPIPILDHQAAAAHWEKLAIARDSVAPLLIMQAQLAGDRTLLQQLQKAYPELAEPIGDLLKSLGGVTEQSRLDSLSMTSVFGSHTGSASLTGDPRQVNALSRVDLPKGKGGNAGDGPAHSGGIGPLGSSFIEPPELTRPRPDAYKDAVPQGHQNLFVQFTGVQRVLDLHRMEFGAKMVLGSGDKTDVRILEEGVSGKHLEIRRDIDGFYIRNTALLRGAKLNGEKLKGEVRLSHGDEILIGRARLVFE